MRGSPSLSPVDASHCHWPPYPPKGESERDKVIRLEEEKEAKKRSEAIDRQLELDKADRRKRRTECYQILLLGQAESGKSTMLKNFQMHFTPRAFQAEREIWRAVIHMNLIRTVNFILELLPNGTRAPSIASVSSLCEDPSRLSVASGSMRLSPKPSNDDLRPLRMRLSPLREVEKTLARRLLAKDAVRGASPVGENELPWYHASAAEVVIRGGMSWKAMLQRKVPQAQKDDIAKARHVLDACRMDIMELWSNPLVHDAMADENINLAEQSGFFLDEADRVAALNYEPSVYDILRARVRTTGVEEHNITVETATGKGERWIFYDVGGMRKQRPTWVPYFEDTNAVIFLCPMSAFDESLTEDKSINGLSDSYALWKSICKNKLLQRANIILLLNKSDILRSKLEAGVSFAQWVGNYKDGANDADSVAEYLKRKFAGIHKAVSPLKRPLHCHITCAIDVPVMSGILGKIREEVIINNLVSSDWL